MPNTRSLNQPTPRPTESHLGVPPFQTLYQTPPSSQPVNPSNQTGLVAATKKSVKDLQPMHMMFSPALMLCPRPFALTNFHHNLTTPVLLPPHLYTQQAPTYTATNPCSLTQPPTTLSFLTTLSLLKPQRMSTPKWKPSCMILMPNWPADLHLSSPSRPRTSALGSMVLSS